MEIKDIISSIASITTEIKDLKTAYAAIPIGIFLPPTKKKLVELQDKITLLDSRIHTVFPQLSLLIRAYDRLISDVRIAKASSDKTAEIIGTVSDLAPFIASFVNQTQTDYGRITSGITQLPVLDTAFSTLVRYSNSNE